MHNQASYGGKARKLSYVKETIVEERCEEKFSTQIDGYEDELEAYYILNLKDKAQTKKTMTLDGSRRYSYNIITLQCGMLGGN